MTRIELNFGSILKSLIRKARAHRGCRYTFGGIITELYLRVGVPVEDFDYYPHVEASSYVVSNVQGLETRIRPILQPLSMSAEMRWSKRGCLKSRC